MNPNLKNYSLIGDLSITHMHQHIIFNLASVIFYIYIYSLFINSCVVFDGNNVVVGVEQHGQLDSDFILPSIIGAMQLKQMECSQGFI